MNLKKKIIISLIPLIIILLVVFSYDYYAKFLRPTDKSSNEVKMNHSNAVVSYDFDKNKKTEKIKNVTGKTQVGMAKETYIQAMNKVVDQFDSIDTKSINQDQYKEILQAGLKSFPEKSLLKKLSSEEVHDFPEPISLAGEFMGILKKHIKQNPDLTKPAKAFYRDCTHKSEIATSIRALCLINLSHIEKEQGHSLDLSQYDPKIVELAKFLKSVE